MEFQHDNHVLIMKCFNLYRKFDLIKMDGLIHLGVERGCLVGNVFFVHIASWGWCIAI